MLTPLTEYLLAVEQPGGGKLCRLSAVQMTIPLFPPDRTFRHSTLPVAGSYCNIFVSLELSPSMVPDALRWTSYHRGVPLAVATSSRLAMRHYNVWVEITEANPMIAEYVNVSGLNQYVDILTGFLVVNTAYELELLHQYIAVWGGRKK